MKKITHFGLFTRDHSTVDKYADRVVKFNLRHGGEEVTMKAMWTEETNNPHCPEPHYDLLFEYSCKEVADKFWQE